MQICFTVASLKALQRLKSFDKTPIFRDPECQDLLHCCLIWQEQRGKGMRDA